MLTELQQEVRRIVARLSECEDVALAGGAAIIVAGIADRPTNDFSRGARLSGHTGAS